MKEQELRAASICAICGRKVGECIGPRFPLPMFWRVTIERHYVKMDVVQRQTGLAMLLDGNAALAHVMGPDEVMTERIMGPATITVCEECGLSAEEPVAMLAERTEGEQ